MFDPYGTTLPLALDMKLPADIPCSIATLSTSDEIGSSALMLSLTYFNIVSVVVYMAMFV